jgi:hypothetical protein
MVQHKIRGPFELGKDGEGFGMDVMLPNPTLVKLQQEKFTTTSSGVELGSPKQD